MKKFSIIILLLMPFFLIYLVSFVGKIYNEFQNIALIGFIITGEDGHVFESGETLTMQVGTDYYVKVECDPDNTTNPEYDVKNVDYDGDPNDFVVNYSKQSLITANKVGEAKLSFVSLYSTDIKFDLNINVVDDQLRDFTITNADKNNEINLGLKTRDQKYIQIKYDPEGTTMEQRGVSFESQNISIATVTSDGLVKPVSVGKTKIKVTSLYNPEISKTVTINVTEYPTKAAYFDYYSRLKDTDYYVLNKGNTIDFREFVTLQSGTTKSQLRFKFAGQAPSEDEADISKLEKEGILEFKKAGLLVTVKLYVLDKDMESSMTVKYLEN